MYPSVKCLYAHTWQAPSGTYCCVLGQDRQIMLQKMRHRLCPLKQLLGAWGYQWYASRCHFNENRRYPPGRTNCEFCSL